MPIDAPETQTVTTWKVACDGGEGALGHPRVWLSIPQDTGWVDCGYCDKRYLIDRDHAHDDQGRQRQDGKKGFARGHQLVPPVDLVWASLLSAAAGRFLRNWSSGRSKNGMGLLSRANGGRAVPRGISRPRAARRA